MRPSAKPVLIGVAGPSCSGKTQIARLAAAELGAPILALDSYYRDLSHLSLGEREVVNFDSPESMDEAAVARHMERLASGEAVDQPIYDFALHTPSGRVHRVEPSTFLLVEGLFALHWFEVRRWLAVGAFVQASHEVCLARRIQRDITERGRTEESVRWQFETNVRPMAERYVIPSRVHAGLELNGEAPLVESVDRLVQAARAAAGIEVAASVTDGRMPQPGPVLS
jgi:uridine kinase